MVESATARLYRRPVVPPRLPRDLAALLYAMTDPDPAARPSAADVVAALQGKPRPHRRRRRVGHALAAAGLLGLVLGGISLIEDAPAPQPVGAVVPVQMDPGD
jgi:hypothetical protein